MTTAKRIEKIDLELKQLNNQRAQLLAAEKRAIKKRRDRQCYIVGGYLINHAPDLLEEIKRRLKRRQDRDAFGLPPLEDQRQDLSIFKRVDMLLPIDENLPLPAQENPDSADH